MLLGSSPGRMWERQNLAEGEAESQCTVDPRTMRELLNNPPHSWRSEYNL